jgi:hypothetical protein
VVTVTYQHQFNYRQFQTSHTPLLQLRLVYPSGSENGIDFDAHLDSGCEGSLFNGHLLQSLGGTVINDRRKRYGSTLGDSVTLTSTRYGFRCRMLPSLIWRLLSLMYRLGEICWGEIFSIWLKSVSVKGNSNTI